MFEEKELGDHGEEGRFLVFHGEEGQHFLVEQDWQHCYSSFEKQRKQQCSPWSSKLVSSCWHCSDHLQFVSTQGKQFPQFTAKMAKEEKEKILARRAMLEENYKAKAEYITQINRKRFDDRMDNQMNLTNLLNKACVGRAKGYLSDLKRRTPKVIWDVLILNLSTVIVHNVKEAKSKLEECCIGENETISSFELRLKELQDLIRD